MAFFDDQSGQNTTAVEAEKFKVGEKEYSMDELSQLVSLGELGREIETKQNTKLDRVYPSLTKAQQELKELREQFEEQKQVQPTVSVDDETAIREARIAAKRVGLVTNDDIKEVILKEFPNYYQQQREAEKLLDSTKGLSEKYNGNDGRPRFDPEDMLGFMRDSGITNAETAYKVRYESELDNWKEQKLNAAKKQNIFTNDRVSDIKQPSTPKVTSMNLIDHVREALYENQ